MADFNTNDAMVEVFLFETSQLLEQLEQIILSSEESHCYSEENINEIFRIMHTIKGSSAMMMYSEISGLSHAIEDLFSYLRKEKPNQNFCSSLNDLILDCVDFIKIELEKIRNRDDVDGNATELVNRLRAYLSELKDNGAREPIKNQDEEKANIFKAVVHFEEGCQMENVRAYLILHNLKPITNELMYYPENIEDDDGSVDIIRREGFHVYLKTYKSEKEIHDFLMQTTYLRELELTKLDEDIFSKAGGNETEGDSSSEIPQQNANTNNCNETDEKNLTVRKKIN